MHRTKTAARFSSVIHHVSPNEVKRVDKDTTTEPTTSRRNFLWKLSWGLAGAVVLEYLWVVSSFLRPRKARGLTDEATIIVAGPVDRFEPGTVTAFPNGRFYLVCLDDGGFLAVSRECTHLGCTVRWTADQQRFVCPCHASSFDIAGDVLSPPAPRALDLRPVRIENNVVKVNVGEKVTRKSFDRAQVTHA